MPVCARGCRAYSIGHRSLLPCRLMVNRQSAFPLHLSLKMRLGRFSPAEDRAQADRRTLADFPDLSYDSTSKQKYLIELPRVTENVPAPCRTLFVKWVISLQRDQGRVDDQAGCSLRCSAVWIVMVFRVPQCIERKSYDWGSGFDTAPIRFFPNATEALMTPPYIAPTIPRLATSWPVR